ncbi:MAG: penicillin-binding protein, partial [Candidatus Binatia bacterium]
VVLTLDSALQYAAERELDRQVADTRARGGLVLMLDPQTGEMLAAAQNPSFDPNDLPSASAELWRNRIITDAFEPGSTLKALLAAAALDEGVASRTERFFCEEGRYRIGRNVIRDHHAHGWLTFEEVFHVSSNICSAKLGARLGAERYGAVLRAFGLDQPTGIDLAGEQAGIVRTPRRWKPIELATVSFGQGIAVTPLQLANAYAALANGGLLMRPYLVRRVVREDGEVLLENEPKVVRRVVREATARVVTEILEGVVSGEGTGRFAAIPGIRVAGKTGTAQKVDTERGGYSRGRIASFVGYFPAEDPKVVLLVVVDEPQTSIWGGTVAAPVFREVGIAAMERFGLRLEEPSEAWQGDLLTPASFGAPPGAVRDGYLGLSLREALALARAEGVTVEVSGSGYVVRQEPPPGEPVAAGAVIRLELALPERPIS